MTTTSPLILTAFLLLTTTCPAAASPASPSAPKEPAPNRITVHPSLAPDARSLRRMEAWHRQYRTATAPVRRALALLRRAAAARAPHLEPICRRLGVALARVDRRDVAAPEFAVRVHLETAFGRLRRAAAACLGARPAAAAWELTEADRAFSQAALALRRYGLEP